jgi:hypothetical protein
MARVGDFYRQRSMIRDQEEEGLLEAYCLHLSACHCFK